MKVNQRLAKRYVWAHVGAFAILLLFPLYTSVASKITRVFSGCLLHDYLFLYCPLCGGTRAVSMLLRLDVIGALRANPLVVCAVVLALCLDIVALVRLLQGRERLVLFSKFAWVVLLTVMIAYGVLRNYLMIAHGYDPLGDLIGFWSSVTA